ncbi:MAG: heme-binding protein [Xanthobacteraceae bacterium]|nr:heme-binding protein [Xanthobacteraceae bacterium]QYK46251.1 MAG: heme-binding protein [Xanthobacteraceae bacterium]
MTDLTLEAAQTIVTAGLKHARGANFKPMGIVVLDARGAMVACAIEDNSSLRRFEIAHGKAHGCLGMGIGGRAVDARVRERPHFGAALAHVFGGDFIPVPGGVLVRNAGGKVIGAVGVSGDTSDNDEIAAVAGIKAAGLTPDTGA